MDRSPYLAQVLAQMGQAPPAAPQQGIDPAMIAQVLMQKKANPEQPRGLGQAMQNLRGVPQRLGQVPGNVVGNLRQAGQNLAGLPQTLGAIPGQVGANLGQLPGLFGLGRRGAP